MIEICGNGLCFNGKRKFLLGVNYWPREQNIKMWKNWKEEEIRRDFSKIKEFGGNTVRIFLLDEDFYSIYGDVNEKSVRQLVTLLDIAKENQIYVLVSMIVGHMSGRNWFIPWAPNNDVFSPEAVSKFAKFSNAIIERVKDHPALLGYLLSNELSLVRNPSSMEESLPLMIALHDSARGKIVSSGDVLSYLQDPEIVRKYSDYVGIHLYRYDTDPVRHGYVYGATIQLYSMGGRVPVVLEEFGFSTSQYSQESIAQFVYEVLWSSYGHGAAGALAWCFSDFTHEADPPYLWKPLELNFGLIDVNGKEKPSVKSFYKFHQELVKVGEDFLPKLSRVGIIIPNYRKYELPNRSYEFLFRIPGPLTTSISFLNSLGINPRTFNEDEELTDVGVIIAPSIPVLKTTTWRKIINSNARLYVSTFKYIPNLVYSAHDALTHLWEELFGVENASKAGTYGRKYEGKIEIRLQNEVLTVELPTPIYTYEVRPVDAEVIATDVEGRPIITYNGKAFLSLLPFELVSTMSENMQWELLTVYDSLLRSAGISPIKTVVPHVETIEMERSGEKLLILINHSYDTTVIQNDIIDGKSIIAGNGTVVDGKTSLPPKGVLVFK
ncbi:mannan endo-1,4-beta-mannosidase [Sulfolobales archaeon HS-7]|nr:mannan endo-1,4-beta-mannosidase [Sulfolobales archaeon HS-7]